MERNFPDTLSALRREKNISQRQAASELGISQALLSHYENGAREPGLNFVCRACDYYGVTADYMLCRTNDPGGETVNVAKAFIDQIRTVLDRAESVIDQFNGEE